MNDPISPRSSPPTGPSRLRRGHPGGGHRRPAEEIADKWLIMSRHSGTVPTSTQCRTPSSYRLERF